MGLPSSLGISAEQYLTCELMMVQVSQGQHQSLPQATPKGLHPAPPPPLTFFICAFVSGNIFLSESYRCGSFINQKLPKTLGLKIGAA
jgi:hypothetical protein